MELPPGFEAGPIQWPYPERIELPPLVSFGYEGEAALLVRTTPTRDLNMGKRVTARELAGVRGAVRSRRSHGSRVVPVFVALDPGAARVPHSTSGTGGTRSRPHSFGPAKFQPTPTESALAACAFSDLITVD